jgi:hypothetical protein
LAPEGLPGLAANRSPLIHDLLLFWSGPVVKIVLDQRESGKVRSQQDKRGSFSNVTTVLFLSSLVRGDTGDFAGPRVTPLIGRRPYDTRKSKTAE